MLTRYNSLWDRIDSWAADPMHFRRAVAGIFLFALIVRIIPP